MTGTQWTEELHAYCDWTHDLGYELGYAAGLRDASRAMDRAIAEALDGPHSYQATTPLPVTAKDVVQRMLRAMQRQAVARRDQAPSRAAVDHPGGPVTVWEADQ